MLFICGLMYMCLFVMCLSLMVLLCVRMRLVVFNFVHVWFGVFVCVCNIGVPNGLLCVCLVVFNGVCACLF